MIRHPFVSIKHRGFAARELGKIYKSKVRRDKLLGMYTNEIPGLTKGRPPVIMTLG